MSFGHPCVHQGICQVSIYLLCTTCCWDPLPRGGIDYYSFLNTFLSSAIRNLCSRCFFFCSVFLIISQVTTTTITPPVTVFECYNGFHFSRLSSIRLAGCGSATRVDPKGHNDGFCWCHYCGTTASTSVPIAF